MICNQNVIMTLCVTSLYIITNYDVRVTSPIIDVAINDVVDVIS